jgi:hypothetical protein
MLNCKVPVADRIRARLNPWELARLVPQKLWSGFRSAIRCDACEKPILNAQVEYRGGSARSF